MRSILFGLTLVVIFGMVFHPAFGNDISVDESSYDYGDIIHISGTVSSVQEGKFIILQIINPDNSDIVRADQFLPSANGSFSKSYPAEGPKWTLEGDYTVKIFYYDWTETTFQLQNESVTEETSNSDPEKNNSNDTPPPSSVESKDEKQIDNGIVENPKIETENPITKTFDFPDLNKSPDHYFKRYENEPEYKKWFDSQFPSLSIQKVVGYQPTHVANFPDTSKSPKSYIDRYNNEPEYKKWFDSQFPNQSIYEILGFPEPTSIPAWIKDNAEWWATGQINDADFISGIQYMIKEEIITIPNLSESSESGGTVPQWIRSNAEWWAQDNITDDDFVKGLEFLVEKGIIRID